MAIQVVVGATRKNLRLTVKDEAGVVINVTAWTARLQMVSKVNGLTIDVAGAIDGAAANGTFIWTELGGTNYVTTAMLAGIKSALFKGEVKYVDNTGKPDWGAEREIEWRLPTI